MKVLSLLQPWATLVVIGAKKIETRSWNTKYRGELLIHASQGKNKDGHRLWHHENCWEKFPQVAGMQFAQLPFGAIIGKVNLNKSGRTKGLTYLFENYHSSLTDILESGVRNWSQEKAFGDYSSGRYGWLLSDPIQFKTPTPAKGALSLWEFDEALLLP